MWHLNLFNMTRINIDSWIPASFKSKECISYLKGRKIGMPYLLMLMQTGTVR